jgi:hypothetical protein
MKIGDRVSTVVGDGVYIGDDLPESRVKRYKFKLDNGKVVCFFPDKEGVEWKKLTVKNVEILL